MKTSSGNPLPETKTRGTNEQQNKSPQSSHGQAHRGEDTPENYTRALLPSQKHERTKCKHFIKWPHGKDRNWPKSILATAGGLIFRQDLLKTETRLEGSSPALPGQDRLFLLQGSTQSDRM